MSAKSDLRRVLLENNPEMDVDTADKLAEKSLRESMQSWPRDKDGNFARLRGEYDVTYAEAVAKQQELGAERLIYLPETKTAFFVFAKVMQ